MKRQKRILKWAKSVIDDRNTFSKLSFLTSTATSFALAAFYGVFAIADHSFWFGSLAMYYFWLVIIKIVLVTSSHKATRKSAQSSEEFARTEIKIYIKSGIALLWIELIRTPSVLQLATMERPIKKTLLLAIVTGYYMVYRIIAAAVNFVKGSSNKDLMVRMIRNISFVEAMCSVLVFTSSMISTFGNIGKMSFLLGYYAIAISAMNILVAIWTIISGNRMLSKSPKKK